jgi:hypothetical protein
VTIVDLMNQGYSYHDATRLIRTGAPLANAAHQRAMAAAPLQEPPGLDQLVASLEKSGPERVKQWLKPRPAPPPVSAREFLRGQQTASLLYRESPFLNHTPATWSIRYLEHPGRGLTGVTDHMGAPLNYTVSNNT